MSSLPIICKNCGESSYSYGGCGCGTPFDKQTKAKRAAIEAKTGKIFDVPIADPRDARIAELEAALENERKMHLETDKARCELIEVKRLLRSQLTARSAEIAQAREAEREAIIKHLRDTWKQHTDAQNRPYLEEHLRRQYRESAATWWHAYCHTKFVIEQRRARATLDKLL